MSELDKKHILSFLREHGLATVSTVSKKGVPDAALVYIYVTDGFDIYFLSKEETQKTLNIQHQPEVVLTVPACMGSVKEYVHIRGNAMVIQSKEKVADIMAVAAKESSDIEVERILPILKHDSGKLIVIHVLARHIRMRSYTEQHVETREIDL